jgi:hypothetical protein
MGCNRLTSLIGPRGLPLILVGLFAGFSAVIASAQTNNAVYAIIENQYIRAKLGESGQENSQDVTGRFVVEDKTTGGLVPIMYGPTVDLIGTGGSIPVPGSYLTVRIDGGWPKAGPFGQPPDPNQPGWDLIFGAAAVPGQANGTGVGTWLLPPTVLNGRIIARWGTLPGGLATNPIPPIQVDVEISLIHDMVCYKFTVTNGEQDFVPPIQGTQTHTIGLRFAQNYSAVAAPTEGPILLDNGPQICTETHLFGSQVPTGWRVTDQGRQNPVGGVLRPTSTAFPGIPPDEFVVASAAIMDTPTTSTFIWEYTNTTIPGFNFCTDNWDAAVAVYWNPRALNPNAQRDYTTYFGRRSTSINFDRPWAAGLSGPETLNFDPNQPVGQQLTPNPFPVSAFVQNISQTSLTNVTAVITLPAGLTLAAGQNATQSVPTLDPNSEAVFNWSIVPNGAASGRLTYSVSFSAGPGAQGKVVTRTIDIPALPSQTFQAGLQMVSFPYNFANPEPSTALGLASINFDLLRWNPSLNVYEAVTRIVPGEGYWLRLQTGSTINLVGATPIVVGSNSYEIRLQSGWQQIGNPFLFPVRWQEVKVISTDVGDPDYLVPITVEEAGRRGWIQPVIFRYEPTSGSYEYDPNLGTELIPFQGYWIKANRGSVSLLVPPISSRAAGVSSVPTGKMTANNWSLRIQASSGRTSDTWNFIGVAQGASDKYDRSDYEKPPAAEGALTVGFARTDWGDRSGLYTRDIQAANGTRKQWDLVVTSPAPNTDVTISWPDISQLPRGTELYVTDKATGVKSLMRQKAAVRVNTGDAGRATLTITAVPGMGAGLQLTGSVRRAGNRAANSAAISVQATKDATLTVRILGATGQAIRTLGTGRAATAGSDTLLTWDYKDAKGVAVPSGAYTVEVKAVTPDGQVARLPIQHIVVR